MNQTSELLNKLNPMQKQAALITDGPLLILAGAGSGKTSVLTHRIAHLIERGVRPFNILAITFTNKAAREMKERVLSLVPAGGDIWVCTFHSACIRILRREIQSLEYDGAFTIYDADDSDKLIKACIRELNINDKLYPVKSVSSAIGAFKDELLSPNDAERASSGDFRQLTMARVYSLYQKKLKANNALDFDDIIYKTVELFILRPDILDRYQERFRYILVDEYQDTNTAQYHLVRLLAGKYHNLCVVGDDDQSIYGWRGANIRNILDFEKDFKDVKSVKLEQNYRSTQTILDAANAVIQNNDGRKDKTLWTESDEGNKISVYRGKTDYDEAAYIAYKIREMTNQGMRYSDFAVLYRMNALSRTLEEQFIHQSLPYKLFGGVNFYSRREIKDLLAYLKLISNPHDNISAERIVNVPKRGIGDTTVQKISEYARANDLSFLDSLRDEELKVQVGRAKKAVDFLALIDGFAELSKSCTVLELLEAVIEKTNFTGDLMVNADNPEERIENVRELLSKAADFCANSETPTLQAFLEEISLVADIDNYSETEEAVTLMTLHSSKGLEFKCVFLAGFEEGLFPSYRAISSDSPTGVEEERRLCYVGITRAKSRLFITCAQSRMHAGQVTYNLPSRFLNEIPKKLIKVEGGRI